MFDTIDSAIDAIRAGKLVIVVDDEDRENEGDFIGAAASITPEVVNFMARYGRGLICTPLPEERCNELNLLPMVVHNTALHETAFTISVDLLGYGCTTGISASDRAKTIKALNDLATDPSDFGRPGHIFPLRAKKGGVLRRVGHTEAATDLTRLAGLPYPYGAVLVEIMNDDGTMARLPDLMEARRKFNLPLISIKDLIEYRLKRDSLVEETVRVDMPTKWGHFTLVAFRDKSHNHEHLALVKGTWGKDDPILTRVHSSCVTGDVLASLRCDCGDQLQKAMRMIDHEGRGVVLYMNQEGRGIGLTNKLKAYKLQEGGMDTVEANLHLGFNMDDRDYGIGAQILRHLGVTKMRLLSNNPRKRMGLSGYGLDIVENVPLIIHPNAYNERYLRTKREKLGHEL